MFDTQDREHIRIQTEKLAERIVDKLERIEKLLKLITDKLYEKKE